MVFASDASKIPSETVSCCNEVKEGQYSYKIKVDEAAEFHMKIKATGAVGDIAYSNPVSVRVVDLSPKPVK